MRINAVMMRVAVVLVTVLLVVCVFALDKVYALAQCNNIRLVAQTLDDILLKLNESRGEQQSGIIRLGYLSWRGVEGLGTCSCWHKHSDLKIAIGNLLYDVFKRSNAHHQLGLGVGALASAGQK